MAMYITTASLLDSGYVIRTELEVPEQILELTLVRKGYLASIFDINGFLTQLRYFQPNFIFTNR